MAGEGGAGPLGFAMAFQPTTIEHLGARLCIPFVPVVAMLPDKTLINRGLKRWNLCHTGTFDAGTLGTLILPLAPHFQFHLENLGLRVSKSLEHFRFK